MTSTSEATGPTGSRTSLAIAIGACVGICYATISAVIARTSPRMLPWVLGRGFGIGGYLCLTALTIVGLWLRHPWRLDHPRPSPQTLHQVHAVLAPLTLLLIAGHVISLAVDSYAGVGWTGAFLPGYSGYRPFAIALGTLSLYAGLVVGLSAVLAGWLGARVWLTIHRFAVGVIVLTWGHAFLAGSDERTLLPIYIATAALVVVMAASRWLATPAQSMASVPAKHAAARR